MLHNAQVVGFAEGTPVLMADGKWKPIEQIKEGDWVMSFDPSKEDSELTPQKVVDTYSTLYRDCIEVFADGKMTIVAKDQLFFTPGAGWLPGYETKQVMKFDGSRQDIQVRRVRGGKFKVYDITVDKTHALVANDLRVHNKSKRKVPAPQPVVTAGRPGLPVSVTTTYRGNTTTVVVNPSPGSSGQVSVSANGSIGVRQNASPGLPVRDYSVDYQPIRVLPYPGGSYVYDRAVNAEAYRNLVCDSMLNKGTNYKVTKADETEWEGQIDDMIRELGTLKTVRVPPQSRRPTVCTQQYPSPCHNVDISSDPTLVNDAISLANQLKKEIKAGRRLTKGLVQQNCDRLASIIANIREGGRTIGINPPVLPGRGNEGTICVIPGPSSYHSTRVYETDPNYAYMTRIASGCTYVYDAPNAVANTQIRYYKHWDPVSNKYYYDRISTDATCSTFGGNTQA